MPTALVTGGCGFIGSHLVDALAARGDTVKVIDDLSTGRRQNLAERPGVELRVGDMCQPELLAWGCAGVDVIYHQAAVPAVPRSIEDPAGTFRVNVAGTHALLLAAREAGARRVVLASSSSVYGPGERLPKHESDPINPVSPYAAQKLAAEQLAMAAHHSLGLEAVALRYFNVYGPRQNPAGGYAAVIPAFASALLAGEPPTINGDGSYSRDFTFVSDVVRANLQAGESATAPGHWINIAGGERVSLLELFAEIAALTGRSEIEPHHGPVREGDVPHSQASVERAAQHLDWTPQVPLADGLRRTIEAMRNERATP